jgi:hypothetical protein
MANKKEPKAPKQGKDLAVWIQACFKQAKSDMEDWFKEARISFDFVAGHQWDDEDRTILEEEDRMPVTFNRVEPIVEAVLGSEINNRQEVTYLPRGVEDSGLNDNLTAAADYVRDNTDAEDAETDAFRDTIISGLGWTETRVDYLTNPDGDIKIDHIDPLEMLYGRSRKRNLEDSPHRMRARRISRTDLEEMFPDVDFDEIVAMSTASDELFDDDEAEGGTHDATRAFEYKYDQKTGYNSKDAMFFVVQFQWYELETFYRVALEGKVVEMSQTKFDGFKRHIEENNIDYVKQKKKQFKQAFVTGEEVLKTGEAPVKDKFSFCPITGRYDRKKKLFYGLVRAMIDPQKWANKFFSQQLHIINTNAKGGLIAEDTAFKDPRKAEEEYSQANSIIFVNEGGLDKIREKTPAPIHPGVDRLMEFSIAAIPNVTGVNMELLGLVNRQQAGVLEDQRKKAGMTILASLFSSLRRYRKESGRLLIDFIQDYISDGRLVRVLGEEGAQYVPLIKNDEAIQYDVIVDESPSSPNIKERAWAVFSQMLPSLLQAGVPILPEILDFSPLPESISSKWKEMIEKAREPDPTTAQLKQAEVEKAQAEAQKTNAEAQETASSVPLQQAELELKRAEVELKREELRFKQAESSRKLGIEEDKADLENAKFVVDSAKGNGDNNENGEGE